MTQRKESLRQQKARLEDSVKGARNPHYVRSIQSYISWIDKELAKLA